MARKSKMNAHLLVEGPNDFHVISHTAYLIPELLFGSYGVLSQRFDLSPATFF